MILNSILKNNAKEFADVVALTMKMGFRKINLTYKQVYELAQKIALMLEQEGLKKSDKVIIIAPNSPYWVCTFWACILKGIIAVPLNTQSTEEMVKKIADQTGAKVIFASKFFKLKFPENLKVYFIEHITDEVENIDISNFSSVAKAMEDRADIKEDDLVQILYTS